MKVTSRDLLAILRRFECADDANVPRQIEHIKITHPQAFNTLVAFHFNKRVFYALFDETAEDDTAYVTDQVRSDKQDITGDVLANPNDHITTYALPFKGKEVYLFEAISTKKRLDTHLAETYPETSRSTWQKHIKAGHVTVNTKQQTSPKYDISETDKISVSLPQKADYGDHELPIVYLDENVIVVNKPVGVLTHSKGALNEEFTVADFFRRYTTFGLDTNRPGIVHRLDRDTSGIIIGARTPEVATMLQKQFAQRLTKKTYLAVLVGHLKQPAATIDLPIGRHPSAPSTFRVDPKGKNAVTKYQVLSESAKYTLVELQPHTGRTHQLRVHMHYLNTPILGDRVYGKPGDRLYLHAKSLEVTLPGGERKTFTAPEPSEFRNVLQKDT